MWKRLRSRKHTDSEFSSISISSSANSTDRPKQHPLPEPTLSLAERTFAERHNLEQTTISDVHTRIFSSQNSARHRKERSQDRRDDPLGLLVLHTPPQRSVDILFIHGLGGTSLRTWCRNRELEYLWPQLWLPEEADLSTARILTFGYNAHFSSKKEHASLTIGDFANDLLFRMKYGENGPERLGQVPIIVVAHSMGGLVFKKAFIHGHMNDEFRGIVSSIKAVLFLATPHRGTDLAGTLNKVLTRSVFRHSPKDYISELAKRSPTIDELNESFRHHASKLRIFSFYETLSTNVGPMSFMILEKHSSLLGYPNETPQPLNANHHDVCKFTSTDDPNYISVVGALRSVVSTIRSSKELDNSIEELAYVSMLLGVSGPPEDDIAAYRAVRMAGTCQRFLNSDEFHNWMHTDSCPVLWVHAPPGSGKSTMCSAVIDHLQEEGRHCAYFLFKQGDHQKRSPGTMLLSLAYQIALRIPDYRHALVDLAKSGLRLHSSDPLTIWKRIYLPILLNTKREAIYWVLDAIDESESSKQVVEFVSKTGDFESPIRILLFGRSLPILAQSFEKAKRRIPISSIALLSNEDIRLFVVEEIEYLPSDDAFKTETVNEIIRRSRGNFLWVSLVLKRIVRCHRQDQVRRVLEETPDGMDEMYDRMASAVADLDSQEDKILARTLFSWAMYAKTPLTVEELSEPYANEFASVMNLQHTISQICGQFVVVDTNNRISLVHHSAREYLRQAGLHSLTLDPETAHEDLLLKCLLTLCDRNLRSKINSFRIPRFLPYAATSWAFHLESCSVESDRVLDTLVRFFSGPFLFPWIQYLSMSGHLAELTAVSRTLTDFVRRRRDIETNRSSMSPRLSDLSIIHAWIADLFKLPAKFGRHLSEDPHLIYKCIPALSPPSSVIFQKFSQGPSSTLSVSGLSNSEWDDCLARVSAGTGRALLLAATSLYLAVATDRPMGSITLWDTSLFTEFRMLNVGEHVDSIAFNNSGSLFACCGLSRTYVWKLTACSLVQTVENPHQERALEFRFNEADSLMIVTDLRRVYTLSTDDSTEHSSGWTQLHPSLMEEAYVPDGAFLGTPSSVSFNSDCTQIAVSYRAFPLSIWNVDPPEMVARLKPRTKRQGQGSINSHTGTNKVIWHPSGTQVIGLYGEIFRWSPIENTYKEVKSERGIIPNEIQCSPNGLVFITSDVEGTIKIYDVAQMTVIYRLTSEDMIAKICFGPNSLRFYDLRGSYCNVWEPNCLLQLADVNRGRFSDTDGMSEDLWLDTEDIESTPILSPISESRADSKPAITAIAGCNTADQHVAYGNDDGVVELFDPTTNTRHTIAKTIFGMGIESLAWNRSHDQLAFTLLNGAVTVKEITKGTADQPRLSIKDVYCERKSAMGRGRVQQLVFDTAGKLLFLNRAKKLQVLILPSGQVAAERDTLEGESAQWTQHPSRPDALISVSNKHVKVFTWQLQEERSIPLEVSAGLPKSFAISAFHQSHHPRLLLLRTASLHLNRYQYSFMMLPTIGLDEQDDTESQPSIKPIDLPGTITQAVAHPLGILPDGRMVFLDKGLWVCTARFGGGAESVTRHFIIPHDWVTSSGLRLCQLLPDGTILCPSKGEVAIIQNDMVSEW